MAQLRHHCVSHSATYSATHSATPSATLSATLPLPRGTEARKPPFAPPLLRAPPQFPKPAVALRGSSGVKCASGFSSRFGRSSSESSRLGPCQGPRLESGPRFGSHHATCSGLARRSNATGLGGRLGSSHGCDSNGGLVGGERGRRNVRKANVRITRDVRAAVGVEIGSSAAQDVIGTLGLDTLTFLVATVIVIPFFRSFNASPVSCRGSLLSQEWRSTRFSPSCSAFRRGAQPAGTHSHFQDFSIPFLSHRPSFPPAICPLFPIHQILGFLLSGVALNQLGLIRNISDVKALSELGILFLLFEMGLELSIERLRALAKFAFGMGLPQVLFTTLAFAAFELPPDHAIGTRMLEWAASARPDLVNIRSVDEALVIGAALSLSSSAFVLQLLSEKGELATRVGSATLGILLLQDIAVVPLLVILPILESGDFTDDSLFPLLAAAGLKSLLGLGVLLYMGRLFLRRFFEFVAESRSTEAFVALCLLTVTGTSLITSKLGFSDSLGAFLAGALLAETNYRTQVEADIRPFRGLLLGLFFVTTGTSIDLSLLAAEWPNILLLLSGLIAIKTAIITALGPRVGLSLPESIRTGLLLSQGGEFAFVVFALASQLGVLPDELNRLLIIVVVLSMALTPLLDSLGRSAAEALEKREREKRKALGEDEEEGEGEEGLDVVGGGKRKGRKKGGGGGGGHGGHYGGAEPIVILGFNHMGQVLANMLSTPLATISGGGGGDAPGWPFVCFDLNPNRVRMGKRLGFPVLYGDGCRPAVLESAGIPRPLMAIVVYSGRQQTVYSVERLHDAFPGLRIYARAVDASHLAELRKAGATDVVLESAEVRGPVNGGERLRRKAGGTDVVLESTEVRHVGRIIEGYDAVVEAATRRTTWDRIMRERLDRIGRHVLLEAGLRLGSMLLQDMGVMRDDVVFLRCQHVCMHPPLCFPQAGLRLGSMLLQDMGVMRDDVVFLRRLMREALDTEAANRRTGQRLLKDRSELGGSWPAKEEDLSGKRSVKEDLGGKGVGKEGEDGAGKEGDWESDSSGDGKGEVGGGSDGLITRAQAIDAAVGFVSEDNENGDAGNNGDGGDDDGDGDGDGGDTGAATPAEGSDVLITRAQALNAAGAFVTSDDDNGDAGKNGDGTGGDGVLEGKGEHLEEGTTSGVESGVSGKAVTGSLTGGADVKNGNSGSVRASGESESILERAGTEGVEEERTFSTSDDGLQYFSDGEDFVDTKLGCNSSSTPREL
ncbi:unnamed protein product [Closterium sp. Naga37s-1]|nr:unnamed protein product [Closterium sp. Naga37s-1]